MSALTDVRINGSSVGPVDDVRTAKQSGDATGEAKAQLVATDSNRQYGDGDDIVVEWSGGVTWTGEIVGKNEDVRGKLVYRALGEAIPLKHQQVYRVFYNEDSGRVVRKLITEQAEQLAQTELHSGDTPSDWRSTAPVAEPYDGGRAGLYDYGTDLLFLGCRSGHSSELRTTYENVGTREIADGFYELQTRLIAPFVAEWNLVVELNTPGGTSYRWEPELQNGAHRYTLEAQKAVPEDSGLNDGELRYRFIPRGKVAENTGFLIDNAATIPFRVSDRQNPLDVSNVETTGRDITRLVDGSSGAAIDELRTEDEASFWVSDGSAYYQPGTATTASNIEIVQGSTPVLDDPVERDYESVRNEIFVQGEDGVEAIARDRQSIQESGQSRPKQISDPQLVREAEAQARAEGELDAATNDTEVTWEIADIGFATVEPGRQISVDWPRRNLQGDYTVSGVVARSTGVVSVTIST